VTIWPAHSYQNPDMQLRKPNAKAGANLWTEEYDCRKGSKNKKMKMRFQATNCNETMPEFLVLPGSNFNVI